MGSVWANWVDEKVIVGNYFKQSAVFVQIEWHKEKFVH